MNILVRAFQKFDLLTRQTMCSYSLPKKLGMNLVQQNSGFYFWKYIAWRNKCLICPKITKMKKLDFTSHFSSDFGYLKIQFRVHYSSLLNIYLALFTESEVLRSEFPRMINTRSCNWVIHPVAHYDYVIIQKRIRSILFCMWLGIYCE